MIKTILIPIDFKVKSLNTLKYFLKRTDYQKVNVVLMYCVRLSDSITEMLFYDPNEIIALNITPDFDDALSILKNRFSKKINSVSIELFHSENTRSLRNFMDAHRIDEVHVPSIYKLKPSKNGFDPTKLFLTAKIKLNEVGWNIAGITTEEDLLESILFNYN